MLKVGHLGELPILNEVTAHKTAWSLRNPSTGSLKKSPVNETSAANATWKSPPCREMSMRHYCAEDTQDNQLVRIGLSKESRELMPADAVEKSDLATRQNSSIRLNFKNSTLLQDCQREMKEIMEVAERYSYERELFQENASSSFIRRDTHEGKEGLLFNWGNQTQKIECKMNESIEATLHRDGVFAANGRTGESSGPAAKPETPGPEREHCNDIGNHGEAKRMTKQGRRDSASKGTSWESKNDLASQCGGSFSPFMLNLMDEFQNSAQTLSLLSTEEEPFDKQEFRNCEGVGFPRIHKRAPNSNYKSYSGCSLHSTESPKFQEKQAKGHEKSNYNNLPKDIGRRLDDSSTPTSMYYFHGSKNCDGSSDGTWVSGYDKMEGLDLPRNGHVIPCHASRSPKYRTNDHVECSERSSRHCFSNSMRKKCGDVAWNHQNALPRESTLASCKSKGSVRMLDSCTEALPLVDNGEIAALSGEDRLDGPLTEYEILELEATSKLDGKRMSNRRICEKLVIALTCRREELEIHKDANVSFNQKYRPRSFDELVGQTMVVQSLVNVILKGRVAPAYLFQGPRGTGKTSTARIFAAALNCVSVEEIRPCGFCPECSAFASGKSSDVREVDAADTNGIERVKALLKSIALTPSFPRFKVFIIDECHMLSWETWAVLLKSLEVLSGHVVFIFITTDPDKLSHAAVSRCQKYLFTKIKDSEIASRLQKLAFEENLDVDSDALDLIAAKSDGSLRDAEMMLDQLSLLGQRINLALVHELVGVVSDEKLLGLLDLALSTDIASTVRKARELMDSGVEPMTLMTQLATLVTDILAGRFKLAGYQTKGAFFHNHALTEEELERLRQALKILSEAAKQLRASSDQTIWITVALLQIGPGSRQCPPLSSSSCINATESSVALNTKDGKGHLHSGSSAQEIWDERKTVEAEIEQLLLSNAKTPRRTESSTDLSFKQIQTENGGVEVYNTDARVHSPNYSPLLSGRIGGSIPRMGIDNIDDNSRSCQTGFSFTSPRILDDIWRRTTEECHSNTLRHLLQTQVKLVSVSTGEGFAIAQLEFWHPDHKTRAERSQKSIVNSLQFILGCNVNVRFCLTSLPAEAEYIKSCEGPNKLQNTSATRQRKRGSMRTKGRKLQLETPTTDSDQRMLADSCKKIDYAVNGSEQFSSVPQSGHTKSPVPAQCFKVEMLSAINFAEKSEPTMHGEKQEGRRTADSAWLQEVEECDPGPSDSLKPRRTQGHPHNNIDLQNEMATPCGTCMVPLGILLQKKEGIINLEEQTSQSNGGNGIQKLQSARIDDPHRLYSSTFNRGTFPTCFEEETPSFGSGSKCGGIFCWKGSKFDQEEAKHQRRQ